MLKTVVKTAYSFIKASEKKLLAEVEDFNKVPRWMILASFRATTYLILGISVVLLAIESAFIGIAVDIEVWSRKQKVTKRAKISEA